MTMTARTFVGVAVLVMSAVAYAVAPGAAIAPLIKPIPALAACLVVLDSPWPGRRRLAQGLGVAAVGDVLVELPATERLGTVAFALAVLVMAAGIRSVQRGPWWPAVLLAAGWAGASAWLVVPRLGDRLVPGVGVLAATALFLLVAGRAGAWMAVGAFLIATNFTLFAVDLLVEPVPRWVVIGAYDVGLLAVAVGATRRRTRGR